MLFLERSKVHPSRPLAGVICFGAKMLRGYRFIDKASLLKEVLFILFFHF